MFMYYLTLCSYARRWDIATSVMYWYNYLLLLNSPSIMITIHIITTTIMTTILITIIIIVVITIVRRGLS